MIGCDFLIILFYRTTFIVHIPHTSKQQQQQQKCITRKAIELPSFILYIELKSHIIALISLESTAMFRFLAAKWIQRK